MTSGLSQFLRGKHETAWKQFATEIHGHFSEGRLSSDSSVVFTHAGVTARLEVDVAIVLVGKVSVPILTSRFVADIPTVERHRFSVTNASAMSAFATWLGAQDVQIGDPELDDALVFKGEDPEFIRGLFADRALRALCLKGLVGQLQLRDDTVFWRDPTPGTDPLELKHHGLVDDLAMLHASFDLFVHVLDVLQDAAGDA